MGIQSFMTSGGELFQRRFQEFSTKCLTSSPAIITAKRDFVKVRNAFAREHQLDEFCDRTLVLTEELNSTGKNELSALLINELAKLCTGFNMQHRAEQLLNLAINTCRSREDGLHELARIIDLEKVYKLGMQGNANQNKKRLLEIYEQKRECCERILSNYETYVQNFHSLYTRPTSRDVVKVQLAFAHCDTAYLLERTNPQESIRQYGIGRDIHKELQNPSQVKYLNERIRRMKIWHGLE